MESKITRFLDYFYKIVQRNDEDIPQDIQEFCEWLKSQDGSHIEKPMFTENGLQILEYLQSNNAKNLKAKDIADGMEESSRKISGAIRKLVSDGYVEKFGQNPVVYSLTIKGKEFNIVDYKERNSKSIEENTMN